MKFNLLNICTLISLALVASHAVTPDVYWKSVLPNTPMPKAINDLIYTSGQQTSVGVGKGDGPPKGPNILFYPSYATPSQVKYYSKVTAFFLEKDLNERTEMNLHFTKDGQKETFLPKHVADSIPFSSSEIPQIYNKFSIESNSEEAEDIKRTLTECENMAVEGEEKYCATSLESMVDFTTSTLGKKIKAISTEVSAKERTPLQKYTNEGAKKFAADSAVVCHKQNYAYPVFYCHKIVGTRAYSVSLVGADDTKAKAVAICHSDTSNWNPKHLAFILLNVKPGSGPICHFLPEDHVAWVPY